MSARGDFHLHSTCSDGVKSPAWVVERAAANGVAALSLTDHDSTAGIAEAGGVAERLGVRLVPGVELSTDLHSRDVHLLGYGFEWQAAPLQEWLQDQRETRIGRAHRIVEILQENGMAISVERVFEIAGEATVGRPHVARALLEKGYVASVQEAFDQWLGDGCPADVPRRKLSPAEAIQRVHGHGGVVFCAHPSFLGDDWASVVEALAGWGLDGIETYYKHYDPGMVDCIETVAARLGLAMSGGSDYHGLGNPDDRDIGDIPFPVEAVQQFLAFIDAHTAQPATGGISRA